MTVSLASPLQLGSISLKNRFVLASLTRNRGYIPDDLNAEYYRQRAGAGLLLTECTAVEPMGSEQIDGWKKVTDAVHGEGSIIFVQLWHAGRLAHPALHSGQPNVGPSAVGAKGGKFRQLPGYVTPETIDDPQYYIDLYRVAAQNVKRAGFDGVEIHSASGFLPHQFIDSTANQRTDKVVRCDANLWGGSNENRARFPFEAVKAAIEGFGDASRVAIKLAPSGGWNDMGDPEDVMVPTYSHLLTELDKLNLAYIQLVRHVPVFDFTHRGTPLDLLKHLRPLVKNTRFLLNGDLSSTEAADLVASGTIDAAVFGRPFVANPDFPHRVMNELPLAPLNFATIYPSPVNWDANDTWAKGYTDYPAYEA
ncbi:hypothetical protein BDK51DRAFT_35948 [Blyttiomyces helicus]|uniref:NADH:flavin oxidoreductase/NADH oxidase N-terminal domain-containing protein n=1 Tax=Blyttiomyces helicus TaxID=388810 RepID=A0A4V1IRP8_9FUNG|nr:hypothetical protein BDK51DRAFT_35948 [Blyttiomyces helicus]|eukprot:RKO90807.1 hypothetical protein BDK51DRAFT_35948 [Blyttiomyces helicus]